MELAELLAKAPRDAWVLSQLFSIQKRMLAESTDVRTANFARIHQRDLELLFNLYDAAFFEGRCRKALGDRSLGFRFAPRMTRAAGTTSKFHDRRTGAVWFQISIATSMLFDGFTESDHREITVCGVECATRLDALQRVFEHELVHLIEQLCWNESNCAAPRFQTIAGRWFLHKEHTHGLITRRERAAVSGIRPGVRVSFVLEGQRMQGIVNRVTKRATVLVEDPNGARYSDGKQYAKFYIPISWLEPATD